MAALHYHRSRNLTGGQTGIEDVNVWFDSTMRLPLRTSGSSPGRAVPLGVTYEENGKRLSRLLMAHDRSDHSIMASDNHANHSESCD